MLNDICEICPDLTNDDISKLSSIEEVLPIIADLVEADVFIDCLTRDVNVAVVVGQAKPKCCKSLYKNNVLGKFAYRENEPAVIRTLQIGMDTRDLKGINQENIMVKQSVVPIKNDSGRIIAVLIMEQDVTNNVNQNKRIEILSETAEQLTQTLINFRENDNGEFIPYHLTDAIVIFDLNGKSTYANKVAEELYLNLGYRDNIVGMDFENLVLTDITFNEAISKKECIITEASVGKFYLQIKYASTMRKDNVGRLIMLIKDITDIKEKEKEIVIKSVSIREIHHRVKNNLQTVVSLLRLQSRRIEDDETKVLFKKCIDRILSISVTHEILAKNGTDDVDIKALISKIKDNVLDYNTTLNSKINAEVKGDNFELISDKGTTIALVVNELLQNALEHAFIGRDEGNIEIIIQKGIMYSNISIQDNGIGFDVNEAEKKSLGLRIVKGMIKDKLNGNYSIESDQNGSKIIFDFEND